MCNCVCSCKEKEIKRNFSHYKFEVEHRGVIERFRTQQEVKDRYNMSFPTIRNIVLGQNRSNHFNSKFTDYSIKKIKIKIEP